MAGKIVNAARKSQKDDTFNAFLRAAGLPESVIEFRFHAVRLWRFDYAWPDHKVALEVEGGVWTKGRHTRPKGFLGDIEKYNKAVETGWSVVRCTPKTLYSTGTISLLRGLFYGQEKTDE